MNENSVSLIAELASAYEPKVGVENFMRRFVFTAPGDFQIEDSIKTNRDVLITSYLHSDTSIEKRDGGFGFEGRKPGLFAEILEPKSYDSVIGPNILTAPGRPGSVDKGEREERGVRLAISNKEKANSAKFKIRLRIQP